MDVKMYFSVQLIKSKVKLTIPAQWIYRIDVVRNFNYGLNRNKKYLIFYCATNSKETPRFDLHVRDIFTELEDACYTAKILFTWPTEEESNEYITHMPRRISVAVFNERNLKTPEPQIPPPPTITKQFENQITIKTEKIKCLESTVANLIKRVDEYEEYEDLTASNIENFQDCLDTSDEEEVEMNDIEDGVNHIDMDQNGDAAKVDDDEVVSVGQYINNVVVVSNSAKDEPFDGFVDENSIHEVNLSSNSDRMIEAVSSTSSTSNRQPSSSVMSPQPSTSSATSNRQPSSSVTSSQPSRTPAQTYFRLSTVNERKQEQTKYVLTKYF